MNLVINQETAELLIFEESIRINDSCHEYLLKTGAKLYPKKGNQFWRISGYSESDVSYYINRYELVDEKYNRGSGRNA